MNEEIREAVFLEIRRQNTTQTALADKLGTTRQYVNRVLSGHVDGSVKFWNDLCDALGLRLTVTDKGER